MKNKKLLLLGNRKIRMVRFKLNIYSLITYFIKLLSATFVLLCINVTTSLSQVEIIDTLTFINNPTPPTSFGDDSFNANLWMPNDDVGCFPRGGCYNPMNDKYYFYGGRRLIVVDGTSNNVINSLTISQDGETMEGRPEGDRYRNENGLAYNSGSFPEGNKIYCAFTDYDGARIKIFDGNDETEVMAYTISTQGQVVSSFVVYDEVMERAYWVVSYFEYNVEKVMIKVIDGGDNTISFSRTYSNNFVSDLIISPDGEMIFIGFFSWHGTPMFGITVIDPSLSTLESFNTGAYMSRLVYNENSDRVYAGYLAENKIAVIDAANLTQLSDIEDLPLSGTLQACANSNNNKVYFTQNVYYPPVPEVGYLIIIDIENGNDVIDEIKTIQGAFGLTFNPTDNKIYCGGKSQIKSFDGTTNTQIDNAVFKTGRNRYFINNSNSNTYCAVNWKVGAVEFYDTDCNFLDKLLLGGVIYQMCYNYKNNKLYFPQNNAFNKASFITIFDGNSNNNIAIKELGAEIRSCTYNYDNNKIFIACRSEENDHQIFVVDGENEGVETIDISEPQYQIYSGPHDKIYSGAKHEIYVINADDYSYEIIPILGTPRAFEYDQYSEPERLFVACGTDRIYVINVEDNTIIAEIQSDIELPLDLAFNPDDNKLYCANDYAGFVTIIDGETYLTTTITTQSRVFEVVYANKENKIYVRSSGTTHEITVIDGENDIVLKRILNTGSISQMGYNSQNNRLYFYKKNDPAYQGGAIGVEVYDCTVDEICSYVFSEQFTDMISFAMVPAPPAYNFIGNKMYFRNYGISNISVIDCAPEIRTVQPGWNWLSFPRLERDYINNDPVDAQTFLEQNIIPFPEYLEIKNLPPGGDDEQFLFYLYNNWIGNLDEIYSDRGYKLQTNHIEEFTLSSPGTALNPLYDIQLYGPDKDNWIGYFIEEPHEPEDAFVGIWDKLTYIQTQYWTMTKIQGYWFETEKVGPLQYGDMVIVKCTEDCSFQWAQDAAPGLPKGYTKTAFFTYEEEADYTPIYVEFDTTDLPLEVGVFCDTICYGAEIVTPSDTMIQINAYIDTTGQGEELEFVYYYGTKNVPVNKRDYWLFNPVTSRMEQKKIRKGENRDWYWVSFKKKDVTENDEVVACTVELLSVQPNPFNEITDIKYCLYSDANITIRIMDMQGQQIKGLVQGSQAKGNYSVFWDGKDQAGSKTGQGVYLLVLETPQEIITEKIILVR